MELNSMEEQKQILFKVQSSIRHMIIRYVLNHNSLHWISFHNQIGIDKTAISKTIVGDFIQSIHSFFLRKTQYMSIIINNVWFQNRKKLGWTKKNSVKLGQTGKPS